MTKSNDELVEEMATVLKALNTDLGDEREVIVALNKSRYRSGDIIACMDQAIEIARERIAADERPEVA